MNDKLADLLIDKMGDIEIEIVSIYSGLDVGLAEKYYSEVLLPFRDKGICRKAEEEHESKNYENLEDYCIEVETVWGEVNQWIAENANV